MKIRLEKLFTVTMTVAMVASSAMAAALDSSAGLGDVRLKGYLGGRLDAMIERHVAGTDADYITAAFMEKTERKGWWQTEFWGKWMHSAVPYLRYLGNREQGTGATCA